MKRQNNFLKTVLLAVALLVGSSTTWADPAASFSIPQNLGSYILIGQDNKGGNGLTADGVTLTGCKVDGDGTCYTVGTTSGETVTIQFTFTAEAGNYLFSFKSGHKEGTSQLSLSLKNSSSTIIWNNGGNNVAIAQTSSSWTPIDLHAFSIGNLEAGETYTMTITGVSKTGSSYYGNFGNFSFHKSTQYATSWNNTENIIFTDAYNTGNSISNDWINSITVGSYVEFYTYTPSDGYYYVNGTFGYATADTDNFTLTIDDVATSTTEVNAVNYIYKNSPDNYQITNELTAGWKKIRVAFPGPTITASFRCQGMRFGAYDALPLTGTATLDLSKATLGTTGSTTPKYENPEGSKNIGYCKDGGYVICYVNNNNETAYYNFNAGISKYNNGGTLKVTVTDVATSTVEINGEELVITEGSGYASQTLKLTAPITSGLKEIRFDFVKPLSDGESDNFLFNFNNVSFYKRSLNESYDYTPVAATDVDVVLTRTIDANKWSTIVLPFDIPSSDITTIFGEGASVAELESGDANTLTFTTTLKDSKMKANQPYAIKVASIFSSKDINGVDIKVPASTPPTQSITDWDFIGTYSSTSVPTGSYYFKSNQLYQRSAGHTTTMKPFRAYLTYTGGGSSPAPNFVIDGETTGIAHISADGQMNLEEGAFYNLNGQRVANPTKGLYIVNGRKVMIK